MEKVNDDILLKSRSAGAAVSAGFRLYTSHFKRIFRFSWIGAAVFAVLAGVFKSYYVTAWPRLEAEITAKTGDLSTMLAELAKGSATMGIGGLLALVANVVFISYGVAVLYQHQSTGSIAVPRRLVSMDRRSLLRTSAAYLWLLLFGLAVLVVVGGLAAAAAAYLSKIAAISAIVVIGLATVLLLVPVYYILIKYVLTDRTGFWKVFGRGYATGMRHYGYMFVILLVDLIVSGLADTVCSLPALVLMSANRQAAVGALMGDPLGMPQYMGALTLVVFILASFIQAYIMIFVLFPLYYMYGSIEKQEEERQEAKQQLLRNETEKNTLY